MSPLRGETFGSFPLHLPRESGSTDPGIIGWVLDLAFRRHRRGRGDRHLCLIGCVCRPLVRPTARRSLWGGDGLFCGQKLPKSLRFWFFRSTIREDYHLDQSMSERIISGYLGTRDGWPANREGNSDAVYNLERDCPRFQIELGQRFDPITDPGLVRAILDFCAKWQLGLEGGFLFNFGGKNVIVSIFPINDGKGHYSDYLVVLSESENFQNLGGVIFLEADYRSSKGIDVYTHELRAFARWENQPYFNVYEVAKVKSWDAGKKKRPEIQNELVTPEERAKSMFATTQALGYLVTDLAGRWG